MSILAVKNIFKFPGLSKTLFIQVSFALLGMIALNVTLVEFYRYKAEENLKVSTFNQIQIIKAAIVQPLWTLDRKALNQIIDSILTQRSGAIAAIRILETDGTSKLPKIHIDARSSKWQETTFNDLSSNENFLFWEVPVSYKSMPIGHLQAVFSVAEARHETGQIALLLGSVMIFFTALCVSVFLMFHLRRLSNELQTQVDERTRELDSQRMAMVNSSRLASLGEMSAGIAHEINNPLAVIDGTIRLISRAIMNTPENEKLDAHLTKIAKMVTRISKIINGLRAFSRDGSQEPMSQFLIDRFFSDISDLCHANLTHKKVDIQFQMDDPGIVISGREVQLSQVMINMINNSADAVENLDEKWIKVECRQESDTIILSVTDSGAGIPLDIQRKMLQPFFTTKELGKGTGLGLSISVGIIESHGGTLTYCHTSKNTKFEIRLKALVSTRIRRAA